MVNDPIANMLVHIKNSARAGKKTATFPYSQITFEIAQLLKRRNYFLEVVKRGKKTNKLVEVTLAYSKDGTPLFSEVRRVSKSSRRIYRGFRDIYRVRNGFGMAVYSTVKGLLTDEEARKEKVGGEVLFELW